MILKKQGKINEIVYHNTVYNDGQNRYYPTINDLVFLITKIIEANDTTEYIRFNPFYVNYRLDRQIEFDGYMFYLECRENFSESDLRNHFFENIGKDYDRMSEEEKRIVNILYPLCKIKDTEKFKELLLSYKTYLNELIPFLFNKAKVEMNLGEDDIPFGFFCFEVHSN
jgi:hypothetical protein